MTPGIGDTVAHPSGWSGRVVWLGSQVTLNGPVEIATVAWKTLDRSSGYTRPPGSFGRTPIEQLTVVDVDETGGAA